MVASIAKAWDDGKIAFSRVRSGLGRSSDTFGVCARAPYWRSTSLPRWCLPGWC